MPKSETESSLIGAATSLDAELRKFEDLAAQIKRMPLNSEKNLERAAKALQDVADSDERLGEHVRALVTAVTEVRGRQQTGAEAVHARALELELRTKVFQELLKHFGTLGTEAGNINVFVQEIAAQDRSTPETRAQVIERLVTAQDKMLIVADGAKVLQDAASTQDFADLARSADNLRQSLLAARNKIGLLHKGLTS
ncbi:MAG: hypothetical protein NVS3B10_21990 [Polyangiales bacterium]